MAETINWLLAGFTIWFMLIAGAVGWLVGHIQGSTWGLRQVERLIQGRGEGGKTVYIRPPGLTQQEQAAWVRAIHEVDREATFRQMLGLETFCCILCEGEPTYELLCGLCVADNNLARKQ